MTQREALQQALQTAQDNYQTAIATLSARKAELSAMTQALTALRNNPAADFKALAKLTTEHTALAEIVSAANNAMLAAHTAVGMAQTDLDKLAEVKAHKAAQIAQAERAARDWQIAKDDAEHKARIASERYEGALGAVEALRGELAQLG